jgi:hypothetical protein
MTIPHTDEPVQSKREILRAGQVRRYYGTKRIFRMDFSCTQETKARVATAAVKLLMNKSEFMEYLMERYAKGLVIILEEGAFLDGIAKVLEDRADRTGAAAGERAALRVLYDRGLVDSPHPR